MWNLRTVFFSSLLLVTPAAWGDAAATSAPLLTNRVDLLAPVPRSEALFGAAVALSADGNRALIGVMSGEACPGSTSPSCGAAYVYIRQEGSWSLEATLKPEELPLGTVGRSVALSPDGTVALVGVFRPNPQLLPSVRSGVYVFVRNGTAWTQEKEIIDPLITDFNSFGSTMALSEDGSTALIADPIEDCVGGFCGQTYVYSRNGGAWSLETQISPPSPGGMSGSSIGLSHDGNIALIGAPGASCASGASCGLVYVFSRNGGTWSQTATLAASDRSVGDSFGASVSLSAAGDIALIGAPHNVGSPLLPNGSVYVFTSSGGAWTERKRFDGPRPGDSLGSGVELSGDGRTALFASNPSFCENHPDCGVIYRSTGGGGNLSNPETLFIFPPGSRIGPGSFGDRLLALSEGGETALVGAPQTPCAAGSDCGVAHVFTFAAASVLDIPALDGPGLLLLLLLLAGSGLWLLRRAR